MSGKQSLKHFDINPSSPKSGFLLLYMQLASFKARCHLTPRQIPLPAAKKKKSCLYVCLCHSLYTVLNDSRHLVDNVILGSYGTDGIINLKLFPLKYYGKTALLLF